MLRLSKMTDYSTVVLQYLATHQNGIHSTKDIAEQVSLSAPTVSKILKLLQSAQIVSSIQGVKGGYKLAKSPESVSIADLIIAMEGSLALTDCAEHNHKCDKESTCGMRDNWLNLNNIVLNSLRQVTLADMSKPTAQPVQFYPKRSTGDAYYE